MIVTWEPTIPILKEEEIAQLRWVKKANCNLVQRSNFFSSLRQLASPVVPKVKQEHQKRRRMTRNSMSASSRIAVHPKNRAQADTLSAVSSDLAMNEFLEDEMTTGAEEESESFVSTKAQLL